MPRIPEAELEAIKRGTASGGANAVIDRRF
jgi:hypothetical protein